MGFVHSVPLSIYLSPYSQHQANFIRKYNARGRNFENSLLCKRPAFWEQFAMPEACILRTVCYARGRHLENSLLCQRPAFWEQFAMPQAGILRAFCYARSRHTERQRPWFRSEFPDHMRQFLSQLQFSGLGDWTLRRKPKFWGMYSRHEAGI